MKLYNYWRSSASWRVRIALACKDVAVRVRAGEHHRRRRRAASRRLPRAEPDGAGADAGARRRRGSSSQSLAILEYLEETRAAPAAAAGAIRTCARAPGSSPSSSTPASSRSRTCRRSMRVKARRHRRRGVRPPLHRARARRARGVGGSDGAARFLVGDAPTFADVLPGAAAQRARAASASTSRRWPLLRAVEAACDALARRSRLHTPTASPTPVVGSEVMAKLESLGIRKLESLHYYVDDLERVRRFFLDKLDFAEIGVSSPELEPEGRQRSAVFQAGDGHARHLPARRRRRARLALPAQAPRRRRHASSSRSRTSTRPSRCSRSAAAPRSPTSSASRDDGGTLAMFSITTPFGDTTFRFVERHGYRAALSRASSRTTSRSAAPTRSASRRSITSRRTSRP